MQEVATLCDHVVVVGGGRVRFDGSLNDLRHHTGESDLEEAFIRVVEPSP
jgi:sodium transport system ATP-binding protein